MSLSRVKWTVRVNKKRLFPGETLSLVTTVENAKFLPAGIQILWPSNNAFEPLSGDERVSRQTAVLLWQQQGKFNRDLVALRRGVHQVGPPRIRSSDPFGFFKKEKRLDDTVRVIVYPRLVSLRPIFLPKRDLFGTCGGKSPVKDPVYILGTRDYQPASPSRHIHWKASARHLRLQEKIFESSAQGNILIVLDVGAYAENQAEEAFEHTLEVIASLAVKLDSLSYAVRFMTNATPKDADFPVGSAGRGPRQVPAILETLARLQMTQNRPIAQILRETRGIQRGVGCAYFAYEDGTASAEVEKICRKSSTPVTVFVCRPRPEPDALHKTDRIGTYLIDEISVQKERQV
jgi:uncharacterized protein (DUF58 family)